jgi:hypothetical protein
MYWVCRRSLLTTKRDAILVLTSESMDDCLPGTMGAPFVAHADAVLSTSPSLYYRHLLFFPCICWGEQKGKVRRKGKKAARLRKKSTFISSSPQSPPCVPCWQTPPMVIHQSPLLW